MLSQFYVVTGNGSASLCIKQQLIGCMLSSRLAAKCMVTCARQRVNCSGNGEHILAMTCVSFFIIVWSISRVLAWLMNVGCHGLDLSSGLSASYITHLLTLNKKEENFKNSGRSRLTIVKGTAESRDDAVFLLLFKFYSSKSRINASFCHSTDLFWRSLCSFTKLFEMVHCKKKKKKKNGIQAETPVYERYGGRVMLVETDQHRRLQAKLQTMLCKNDLPLQLIAGLSRLLLLFFETCVGH